MWFVVHAAQLGWQGATSDAPELASRVYLAGATLSNLALALHMGAGALLTMSAPLQALPPLRRYWPGVHRRAGYVLFGLAILTAMGGLLYILVRGTVGGWWMSLWFAIYGVAMGVAAMQTVRFARQHDFRRHFRWATRLIILAVGSWIYRVHYGLWYALTDGLGSNQAFTGLFDEIQVVAFFVPYLLIAEFFLRRGWSVRAAG